MFNIKAVTVIAVMSHNPHYYYFINHYCKMIRLVKYIVSIITNHCRYINYHYYYYSSITTTATTIAAAASNVFYYYCYYYHKKLIIINIVRYIHSIISTANYDDMTEVTCLHLALWSIIISPSMRISSTIMTILMKLLFCWYPFQHENCHWHHYSNDSYFYIITIIINVIIGT